MSAQAIHNHLRTIRPRKSRRAAQERQRRELEYLRVRAAREEEITAAYQQSREDLYR